MNKVLVGDLVTSPSLSDDVKLVVLEAYEGQESCKVMPYTVPEDSLLQLGQHLVCPKEKLRVFEAIGKAEIDKNCW